MTRNPETLWTGLLSRNVRRIRSAWDALTEEEQAAVRAHLVRMATEDGWSDPQRVSAEAALVALDSASR